MDDKNITKKLKELASGNKRPVTQRLREIFDDIDAALLDKTYRKDVFQELKEGGFAIKKDGTEITFGSFEVLISRIRNERRLAGTTATSVTSAPAPDQSASTGTSAGNTAVSIEPIKPVLEGAESEFPEQGSAVAGKVVVAASSKASLDELKDVMKGKRDYSEF